MKYKEFFDQLDVSAPALFAGIAGGSILMLKYRDISMRRAVAIVAASGVASGYLTEITVHGLGLKEGMIGAIGFTIGLLFVLVLDVIVAFFKYIAAHPKEVLGLLISIIPFRKNKTTNEETFIDDDAAGTELDPNAGSKESAEGGQDRVY